MDEETTIPPVDPVAVVPEVNTETVEPESIKTEPEAPAIAATESAHEAIEAAVSALENAETALAEIQTAQAVEQISEAISEATATQSQLTIEALQSWLTLQIQTLTEAQAQQETRLASLILQTQTALTEMMRQNQPAPMPPILANMSDSAPADTSGIALVQNANPGAMENPPPQDPATVAATVPPSKPEKPRREWL